MVLGDDNCAEKATLSYAGTCPNTGGCDGGSSDGATGDGAGETSGETSGGETGDPPDFGALELSAEVSLVSGEYVVSQALIDTALADPVGLSNDGTTARQVLDVAGEPYGFEVEGVMSSNLGGVLGLRDGDIVTEVAGRATRTYADLLELAGILLAADSATVVLDRGPGTVTLRYRRGP